MEKARVEHTGQCSVSREIPDDTTTTEKSLYASRIEQAEN